MMMLNKKYMSTILNGLAEAYYIVGVVLDTDIHHWCLWYNISEVLTYYWKA